MPRISDPALLAQLETPQAQINKGAPHVAAGGVEQPTLTGDARNLALQKLASLRLLAQQTNRSAQEFDRSQNGAGTLHSLIPGRFNDGNARFDATVEGITPLAKAAFRVPGSGADSDKESAAFLALLPDRYSGSTKNLERYKQMSQILKSSIDQQRALVGMRPGMFGAPRKPATGGGKVVDWSELP